MVRPLGFLVGLGFITALVLAILTTPLSNEENVAYSFHKEPRKLSLASDGLLPHWDKQQLQRGMQVYKEVCSACHSLKYVAFRDLEQLGYSEGQVKAYAAAKQVPGIDPNTGEATMRPGLPTETAPALLTRSWQLEDQDPKRGWHFVKTQTTTTTTKTSLFGIQITTLLGICTLDHLK